MSNYLDLGNGQLQMAFGVLAGVKTREHYDGGELKSVKLCERNVVLTHAGELYPAFSETPRRKNRPSVEFYQSGLVRAVALEEQQDIVSPIGELPAELVTFYDSGELHRVFPVDGQLSGFWSEEDERSVNIPLSFELGFAEFSACLNSICFYKSGNIKSITLFPGDIIAANTTLGEKSVRHGFSMYETGELRSVEPAVPIKLKTPIGHVTAFDSQSVGISADTGSVLFDKNGSLLSLRTDANKLAVQTGEGRLCWHEPVPVTHFCSDEETAYKALQIDFDINGNSVTITDDAPHKYSLSDVRFTIFPFHTEKMGCSPADCASCKLCSG